MFWISVRFVAKHAVEDCAAANGEEDCADCGRGPRDARIVPGPAEPEERDGHGDGPYACRRQLHLGRDVAVFGKVFVLVLVLPPEVRRDGHDHCTD